MPTSLALPFRRQPKAAICQRLLWLVCAMTIGHRADAQAKPGAAPPTIACADSSARGTLGSTPCTIFAKRPIQVRGRSVLWTLEKFRTPAAAKQAMTGSSAAVTLDGQAWLLSVDTAHRPALPGALRVAEIGPLPLPRAARYEMILAYVGVPPGAKSAVHVQSGPEAWYVLEGSQCVETPDTVMHIDHAHPGFVPADTPLFLVATGTTTRRAFFVIVHDADRPFYTEIQSWKPRGRCQGSM